MWSSGIALARYIETLGKEFFAGKSCVELGSGCGLTGIVAHLSCEANIILTDKLSLVPLLNHNINKNVKTNNEKDNKATISAKALEWGKDNESEQYDIIIGADLTHDVPIVSLLKKNTS